MENNKKIDLKDLNIWLKIGIIGGWISLILYGLSFLIGFIEGIISI